MPSSNMCEIVLNDRQRNGGNISKTSSNIYNAKVTDLVLDDDTVRSTETNGHSNQTSYRNESTGNDTHASNNTTISKGIIMPMAKDNYKENIPVEKDETHAENSKIYYHMNSGHSSKHSNSCMISLVKKSDSIRTNVSNSDYSHTTGYDVAHLSVDKCCINIDGGDQKKNRCDMQSKVNIVPQIKNGDNIVKFEDASDERVSTKGDGSTENQVVDESDEKGATYLTPLTMMEYDSVSVRLSDLHLEITDCLQSTIQHEGIDVSQLENEYVILMIFLDNILSLELTASTISSVPGLVDSIRKCCDLKGYDSMGLTAVIDKSREVLQYIDNIMKRKDVDGSQEVQCISKSVPENGFVSVKDDLNLYIDNKEEVENQVPELDIKPLNSHPRKTHNFRSDHSTTRQTRSSTQHSSLSEKRSPTPHAQPDSISQHIVQKMFECSSCYKKFSNKLDYTNHMRSHSINKPFQCTACDRKFPTKSKCTRHMRLHAAGKPYYCVRCKKAFTHFKHLSSHISKLHTEKFFKCYRYTESFTTWSELARHGELHSGVRPYKCQDCNVSFKQKSDLSSHKRDSCKSKKQLDKTNKRNAHTTVSGDRHRNIKTYQKKKNECIICGKFVYRMKDHMDIHAGKKYPCSYCEKKLSTRSSMMIHEKIHISDTPYMCTICNKRFETETEREDHILTHNKQFKCSYCDKSFTEIYHMRQHQRIHNNSESPSLKLSSIDVSKYHSKCSRTNNKSYRCKECKKTFRDSCDLRVHMRVHTGKKTYKCTKCDKHYTLRQNLKRHMIIHTFK